MTERLRPVFWHVYPFDAETAALQRLYRPWTFGVWGRPYPSVKLGPLSIGVYPLEGWWRLCVAWGFTLTVVDYLPLWRSRA